MGETYPIESRWVWDRDSAFKWRYYSHLRNVQ